MAVSERTNHSTRPCWCRWILIIWMGNIGNLPLIPWDCHWFRGIAIDSVGLPLIPWDCHWFRGIAIDSVGLPLIPWDCHWFRGIAIDSVGWAMAMFKEPKSVWNDGMLWRWADEYHELAPFFHDNDYQGMFYETTWRTLFQRDWWLNWYQSFVMDHWLQNIWVFPKIMVPPNHPF